MKKTSQAILVVAVLAVLTVITRAQTCTPPLFQGYPNSCSTINLRWLNRDAISLIDHYEIHIGAQLRGTAPANAISFSDPVGCGFGATYTITQVMKSGARCSVVTTGNPPHTSPCNLCQGGSGARMATRNAASFSGSLAANSIGSAFGDAPFSDRNEFANWLPLPTVLAGARLLIAESEVPLFYASPSQINFYVPNLHEGLYNARAISSTGSAIYGDVLIIKNAPGIFTRDASGTGQAACDWLVVSSNGTQRYLAYDRLSYSAGDRVFLILYATGINERVNDNGLTTGTAKLRVVIGTQAKEFSALYAGPTIFAGVQQMNFEIPLADIWSNSAGAQLTVTDFFGSSWLSNGIILKGR